MWKTRCARLRGAVRPCLALCLVWLWAVPVAASSFVGPWPAGKDNPWVDMPAGGRASYIGIHGGTVPVSLLTSRDGSSMVTFVGQTGNDFLRTLRRMDITPPTQLDPAVRDIRVNAVPPSANATILKADTAIGAVPVFYVTGHGFARMDLSSREWLPFGLSEKPLRLEGQAVRPLQRSKVRTYRHVLLPGQRR